jgi:hypothetical protein
MPEIAKKISSVDRDVFKRNYISKSDSITFDRKACQRHQAYQIKPLEKFLVRTCRRFSNLRAGFRITDVIRLTISRKLKNVKTYLTYLNVRLIFDIKRFKYVYHSSS